MLNWDRNKDPDEVVDYDLNWLPDLDGDIIVASQWILVEAAGLTINSGVFSDTAAKVWLSGGSLGETATLTNRIVTAGGRTLDQSVKLKIRMR